MKTTRDLEIICKNSQRVAIFNSGDKRIKRFITFSEYERGIAAMGNEYDEDNFCYSIR